MQSQIRGLAQASLNINRSRGLLQTADSALESQRSIVQEMRDLALEAANTTLSSAERSQINETLANLVSDFQNIAQGTEFNGIRLLDGSLQDLALQVGADFGDQVSLSLGNMQASESFQSNVPKGEFDAFEYIEGSAGGPSSDIRLEDVDNDGNLDRIVAYNASDEIGVSLGNGDGSFQEESTFDSTDPLELELADFDGDGNLDILTTDTNNSVYLYLGDGEGGFTESSSYGGILTSTQHIEIGDLDNDGDIDILRIGGTAKGGYAMNVLENDGDNNFSSYGSYSLPTGASDFHIGDLDGDGALDIAYLGDAYGKSASGTLRVRLGGGDLSFGAESSSSVKPTLDFIDRVGRSLDLGDIDGDGDLDAVVSTSGDIVVELRNNGAGSFGGATSVGGLNTMFDMELADIDGDGNLDIVGTNTAFGYLQTRLGDGDGTFSNSQNFSGDLLVGGVMASGDLNNDGAIDVILGNAKTVGQLETYIGRTKSVSGLSDIRVDSAEEASNLIEMLDETVERIQKEQSKVGALLSRLDLTEAYNSLMSVNYQEALDASVSADYALEVADLLQTQILQQAQVAALSQSNLQRDLVLELLP